MLRVKKIILAGMLILMGCGGYAQGFFDEFADGDFTGGPAVWGGLTTEWVINAGRLNLNKVPAAANNTSYISTPSVSINGAVWEFNVELTANPSATNYVDVFLVSDRADLSNSPMGYFVRLGNANDEISLYTANGAAAPAMIIDGPNGLLNLANPIFKVRVTRSTTGDWAVFTRGTSLFTPTPTYTQQGLTVNNTTYGTSSHFGFRTTFTSTRNTWCYFDSVDVSGPGFVDTTPPTVTSVSAVSATEVDVVFSENVGITTAQTAANYLLNGATNPTSAVIQNLDSTRVRLSFAAPFGQCTANSLQTSNVTDRAANVMLPDTRSFTYAVAGPATWKSVVVSEIMADAATPSPICLPVGIDYIELYNRGNNPVDLQNWTISDGVGSPVITSSSFLLCPGEYVLLTGDTLGFPGAFKKIRVTSFPGFNSPGDPVFLRDGSAAYIDSLRYATAWYQDAIKDDGGWSLELINLDDTCSGQSNWIASNGACGGTPGVQNSVFSTAFNTTAPAIASLSLPGGNVVDVCFTEPVDPSILGNPVNYSVNNGLGVPSAATVVSSTCVSLQFGAMQSGVLYTLTASNIADCLGNTAPDSENFLVPGPASFKSVIINEIYADPDSAATNMPPVEFVEIYNRSGQLFDLAGWSFSDPSTTVVLPSHILAPGDYLVLCLESDTTWFSGLPYLGLSTFPGLNNPGDNISLRDQLVNLVDAVTYDISWYQDPVKAQGGWTLELINPTDTCALFGNWIASQDPDGGTPGAVNSVLNTTPDLSGPALLSVNPISTNTLELCFDEPIDAAGLIGGNFVVTPGIGAATAVTASSTGECLTVLFGSNFSPGQLYTVTASNLQDCKGNVGGGSGQFILSGPAAFKAVIFNELYPEPDSAATAMPPVEFVELYNRSGQLFDLVGWTFSDRSATVVLPNHLLAPGAYVILCKASDTTWFTGLPHLGLSSLPSLNNTDDDLYLSDPFGNIADSVRYDISWYQNPLKDDGGWTLELINPQDTCSQLGNWIASQDTNGGTPGLQNSVFNSSPDLTAPLIASLDITGANTLDLCFNETMDASALATAAHYLINNGIGAATSAVPSGSAGECVSLTFASSFIPGTVYTLSTANLGDCKGNLGTDTEDFLISPGAASKDVLINEIFADFDTAATAMPGVEFVELYNRSSQVYNLGGWSFADASTKVFLGNYILQPGAYVVLCAAGNVGEFPGAPVLGLSSLPSLNNTGDQLGLRDQNGGLIDTVEYDLSYYGDPLKDDGGWTMELINPNAICNVLGNWHASYDTSGGTPGLQNSAFNPQPDTTGPVLAGISILSPLSIEVCFDELMDAGSLTTLTNYSVDNGLGGPISAVANSTSSCVTLTFTNLIDTGTVYTLTTNGLSDCVGNLAGVQTGTFVQGGVSARFQIVINEIFCDATPIIGLPEAEFVEIYNKGTTTVDLNDWVLTDRRDDGVLPAYSIQPGEHVILCGSSDVADFSAFGTALAVSGMPGLNNDGDSLELYDASGQLIDLVYYTDEWYHDDDKTEGGWTIERKDATFDCMNADNWAASTDVLGGTPGRVNSVAATFVDQTPPTLLSAYLLNPTTLVLNFDEPMQQTPLLNPLNFNIDGGIGFPISTSAFGDYPTRVVLDLGSAPAPNTVYCVTVQAVRDCPGNTIGADNVACFGIPLAAEPGDILINEVLYNAYPGGNRFVELYNHSDKIIDLAALRICYTNDDGEIDGFDPFSDTPLLLLPGEYAAFVEGNRDLLLSTYLPLDPDRVFLIGNLPTWEDADGSVIVLRDDSLLIDSLHYFKEWAFPDLTDQNGVSLERHDFNRPTQDEYNWHSAASTVRYATPGYVNSQILQAGDSSDVWVTPIIFSPDLDQRDDVLSINYNFSTPALNAQVTIYDNRGRLVKLLQPNMILPTGNSIGTITWDGTNDAGVVANIGVYVIYFEATSPDTGERFVRKVGCVLAK